MPTKALIFDLDGVLANTLELHLRSWQHLAERYGRTFTRANLDHWRGKRRRECLIEMFADNDLDDDEIEHRLDIKNQVYLDLLRQATPDTLEFPGARPLLVAVRQRGLKLGIASSSLNAHEVIDRLELAHLIDVVYTFDFYIDYFDSELVQLRLRFLQDLQHDLFAAGCDSARLPLILGIVFFDSHLIRIQFTVAFTNGFDEAVAGDGIPDGRVNNFIEAALCIEYRVHGLFEFDWVGDAPAGKSVHPNVGFLQRWNLSGVAIPKKQIFRKFIYFIKERQPKIKAWIRNRFPDDFAKACYNDLLGFIDDECGCVEYSCCDKDRHKQICELIVHCQHLWDFLSFSG